MKVKVRQKHIDEGCAQEPSCCPIALALEGMGHEDVFVSNTTVDINLGAHKVTYALPEIAERFVEAFDEYLPVEPFEFELKEI